MKLALICTLLLFTSIEAKHGEFFGSSHNLNFLAAIELNDDCWPANSMCNPIDDNCCGSCVNFGCSDPTPSTPSASQLTCWAEDHPCNPIDDYCCGSCVNFGCSSFNASSVMLSQNLLQATLTNTTDFIEGTIYGLFVKQTVEALKSLATIPGDVKTAFAQWSSVDWTNGTSILNALSATGTALTDTFNVLSKTTDIDSELGKAGLAVVVAVDPELAIFYEAGKYFWTLGSNMQEVTEDMQNLYEGFSSGNFNQAGEAFGSLINDGAEFNEKVNDGLKNGVTGGGEAEGTTTSSGAASGETTTTTTTTPTTTTSTGSAGTSASVSAETN